MRQRIREIHKNDKGFTLIELLIVIVILGVLAGIVVFAVGAFNDRGEIAACKSDVASTEVAVEAFKAKSATKVYPASLAVLVTGGYLKSEPDGAPNYTIAYDSTTGAVDGTMTVGGADCFA
jgi:general secretion pathway protein G